MQIEELNNLKLTGGQIQKIYSSSRYIDFQVRIPGKTIHLLMGRGKGFEGLWTTDLSVPSYLRARDHFLEYLRKHLTSKRIFKIQLDEDDRIIQVILNKDGEESFFFFYRGRDLLFAHFAEKEVFLSWSGKKINCDHCDFSLFDEVGRSVVDSTGPSEIALAEELINEEKKALSSLAKREEKKSAKKIKRKIENIAKDLEKVSHWRNLEEFINQSNLEELPKKTVLFDLKFHFVKEGHYARRSEIFDKIKKLKNIEKHLATRLDEAKQQKEKKHSTELTNIKPIAPVWLRNQKKSESEKIVTDGFKLFQYDEYEIGLGLNSQGNDQLRSKWAKKEDIWVHLDGATSAHVIIKLKSKDADIMKALKEAAKLIGTSSEIDIIFTKVKNLKSVKGQAGKVIYSKEKHVRIRL